MPRRTLDPEASERHRRTVLWPILLASLLFAGLGNGIIIIRTFQNPNSPYGASVSSGLTAFALFTFLAYLVRRGRSLVAAYGILGIYLFLGLYCLYAWGYFLPQGLLLLALVITVSSIVLNSAASFFVTALAGGGLVVIAYLQFHQRIPAPAVVDAVHSNLIDGIFFAATLAVFFVLTGIYNRTIERSLVRAMQSEAALSRERDLLEERVEERTRALMQAQYERLQEVHRLATVGRHAAGLLHDLRNPLTTQLLSLEQIQHKSRSPIHQKDELQDLQRLLDRTLAATRRMEEFIEATRRQIANDQTATTFSVEPEVRDVTATLAYAARRNRTTITTSIPPGLTLHGNPIGLHKILLNLIENAIDSFDAVTDSRVRRIDVRWKRRARETVLCIEDTGSGIPAEQLSKVFDLFYTTKPPDQGSGIGLPMCREIIEQDFHGEISLVSTVGSGTTVTATFPHA